MLADNSLSTRMCCRGQLRFLGDSLRGTHPSYLTDTACLYGAPALRRQTSRQVSL